MCVDSYKISDDAMPYSTRWDPEVNRKPSLDFPADSLIFILKFNGLVFEKKSKESLPERRGFHFFPIRSCFHYDPVHRRIIPSVYRKLGSSISSKHNPDSGWKNDFADQSRCSLLGCRAGRLANFRAAVLARVLFVLMCASASPRLCGGKFRLGTHGVPFSFGFFHERFR